MNSAVIVKVEYKLNTGGDYHELDVIPHSGNIAEENAQTDAGIVFTTTARFKIAQSQPATDAVLNNLIGRQASFRITDANEVKYTIGDSSYRARFHYTRRADGSPGSFNGYECQITRQATTGCAVE